MCYIVVKFKAPGHNTFRVMSFLLVIFCQVRTDRTRRIRAWAPGMGTGGLNNTIINYQCLTYNQGS